MSQVSALIDQLIECILRYQEYLTDLHAHNRVQECFQQANPLFTELVSHREQITSEMQERIRVTLGDRSGGYSYFIVNVEKIMDRSCFLELLKAYPESRSVGKYRLNQYHSLWASLLSYSDTNYSPSRIRDLWNAYIATDHDPKAIVSICFLAASNLRSLENPDSYINYLRCMIEICPQVTHYEKSMLLRALLQSKSKHMAKVIRWYLATYPVSSIDSDTFPRSKYIAPIAKLLMAYTFEYEVTQWGIRVFYLYDADTKQVLLATQSRLPVVRHPAICGYLQFCVDGVYVYSDQIFLYLRDSCFSQCVGHHDCPLPAMTDYQSKVIKFDHIGDETVVVTSIPQFLADVLHLIRSRKKSARSAEF